MARSPRPRSRFLVVLAVVPLFFSFAASLPDTPSPPLQWLNLTNLLRGASPPPPLKDALIGYDETSRSVIIFGGESASGLTQSQTYLLNLDTLTWSLPSPPSGLARAPPARSSAVAGGDFAASNRHGFVVIGGKGADGKALNDVWEYDFLYQFWSQVNISPGGPSPRWGCAGGIDISTHPIQDPVVPGPNNSFYIAGGSDGVDSHPFPDVWRLNISGTLSPNLPDNANGSWELLSIPGLTHNFNQAGTVVADELVLTGGCNSTHPAINCPQRTSYVIDTQLLTQVSPTDCPAPRTGPVIVANPSRFTSAYTSQIFLLLGTVDTLMWDEGGFLSQGEVAILDIKTGAWSRVLPAGDPGFSRNSQFPTPRTGAAAFSYPQALVGPARTASADTLIFGGQDASGNVLSEVWLLRAYNASVSPSNPNWFGFGNGQLQTGIDASGTGVAMKFLSNCSVQLENSEPPKPTHPSHKSPPLVPSTYDTANTHKIFAPVSLALLQLMLIISIWSSPLYAPPTNFLHRSYYSYANVSCAIASYGIGVAGFITSFTTISARGPVKRLHLRTAHGIACMLIYVLLYGVLLPLLLVPNFRTLYRGRSVVEPPTDTGDDSSGHQSDSPPSGSNQNFILSTSPPRRIHSWGPSGIIRKPQEVINSDRDSVHSAVVAPTKPTSFEVLNRPARTRKVSGLSAPPFGTTPDELATSLQQVDWLQRRRSLNVVDELDYAITQAQKELRLSTTATADGLMSATVQNSTQTLMHFPSSIKTATYLLTHAALLGLNVLSLLMIWFHAPVFAFVLFLVWTATFYLIFSLLVFRYRSPGTMGRILNSRYTFHRKEISSPVPPQASVHEQVSGPYAYHEPPYRVVSNGSQSQPNVPPRTVDSSDDDDNMDDDTRQRVIEEEMGRREVSIITIPKRKLLVANPS